MIIRDYHPSDHTQVIELLKLNTPAYFAPSEEKDLLDFLANHIDRYFVAEANGKIIACGGFNLADDGKIARISWDIVHPESQGIGIGSELTRFRLRKIREIESVETISVRTTQLVYLFYGGFGFETKEVIGDFWADGFDLYRMEREKVLVKSFEETFFKVLRQLERKLIVYKIHRFPSGVAMIDIWVDDLFYVIQFEENSIGISEVNNENASFDMIPDKRFDDESTFLMNFRSILKI